MPITYKFYLRSITNFHKLQRGALYLRVTYQRRSIVKSLGVILPVEHYDEHRQIVLANTPEAIKANALINEYMQMLKLIYHHAALFSLTFEDIKERINTIAQYGKMEFFTFLEKYYIPQKLKAVKSSSIKKYKAELLKLKAFKPHLRFSDITPEFIVRYKYWLRHHRRNNANTTERSIRSLKTIMKAAYEMGFTAVNPIENVPTKRLNGQRAYLSKQELIDLHQKVHQLPQGRLREVGLIFLFACYTGLRYSDIKQLKYAHLQNDTIRLKMVKTEEEVVIPLNNRARQILQMVQPAQAPEPKQYVFRVLSNQKMNKHLKTLAMKCDLQKHLTFHVARHTFATVSIEVGIPVEVVSKLLGHSDIKTTMIYARILDPVKKKEMEKWNF